MVETVMIFALGFLAATLIALLIIPALNARAERLARRRAEAMFPLSISELTAEKDHLRAEFAVLQRRIERKAEEAQAVKHQSLEELGRRAIRIEALESDLAARDGAVAQLEADLAQTRSRLQATEDELAGVNAQFGGTRETLNAIEAAHRRTLDELGTTRAEVERANTALATAKSELAVALDRLEAREAEFSDLDGRHTALLSEMDAKRITISDLETRLATQMSRGNEFERSVGDHRTELADERHRMSELARTLLAEQERALTLEQRIRELEGGRDGPAKEIAAAEEPLPAPQGDGTLIGSFEAREAALTELEQQLEQARIRIAALETEDAERASIRSENQELREMVVSVADQVVEAADRSAPPPRGQRKARG